jgi:hypothetical protein
MSSLVSPKELINAACAEYLNGRMPKTDHEWEQIVNYLAFNIMEGMEFQATKLVCMIFDCPLSDESIRSICAFQLKQKRGGSCSH